MSTSALNVQPSGCYLGYCDFARCLRRVNSVNLVSLCYQIYITLIFQEFFFICIYILFQITQCTREARTGVNITLDADNIRFFTNVTSCILAKTRCGTFNPITGDPQTPGYTTSGLRVSNALQFSEAGEIRVLSFSTNTPVSASFCAITTNLTQTNWLTNNC